MMQSLPVYAPKKIIMDVQTMFPYFQTKNAKQLSSVMSTIKKLSDLKDRNWSMKDINANAFIPKYRVDYQRRLRTSCAKRVQIHRLSNNAPEFKIERILHTSGGMKFNEIEQKKLYGVSNETSATSWVDRGVLQATSNHESTSFNLLHHGDNIKLDLKAKLIENPNLCRKSKGIAEYSDLTRVSASKLNDGYQAIFSSVPKAFVRSSGSCAVDCDNMKTFGPAYNFFKK